MPTFDPIFAKDPGNPNNVASNATITIFDPADPNKTPIALTNVEGAALPNPITVDRNGMGPAFQHDTLYRVGWEGGGLSNYFTAYEQMHTEAVAARDAAETSRLLAVDAQAAATNAASVAGEEAATAAATQTAAALANANAAIDASAQAAQDAAALVDAPAGDVVRSTVTADLDNPGSGIATKISATYGEGYDVIVVLGQSNAKGTNSDYDVANIDMPHDRVFAFPESGTDAGKIVPAVVPLRGLSIDPGSGMGPGFPFALQWTARTNRRILIVKVAVGSTGFEANGSVAARWKVEDVAGTTNLYKLAVNHVKAALAAAGGMSKIVAVLWHQGEADSNIASPEATYAANLDNMIVSFRAEVPAAKTAPFLVGQMKPERLATQAGTAGVNAAHIATPNRVPLTGFAPAPANYPAPGVEDTHFNAAGQRILARSYLDAYDRAVTNLPGIVPGKVRNLRITDDAVEWEAAPGRVTTYELSLTVGASLFTENIAGTRYAFPFGAEESATVKVRAISEAGPGEYANAERYRAVASGPVVDPLEGISFARAYSLRKVVSTYEGPLVRVRRDSDNTETDAAAMSEVMAFAGSGSAYVTKWYDQSGAGRDLTQTETARQPRVLNAGTLETLNGKPAVRFDATDDILTGSTAGMFAAGTSSIASVVMNYSGSTPGNPLLGEHSSTSTNPEYILQGATSYTLTQFARNDSATTFLPSGTVDEDPGLDPEVPRQFTVIDTGAVFKKRVAKTNLADVNYTRTGTTTLDRFNINGRYRNGVYSHPRGVVMAELLVAHTAWDDATRDKVEGAQATAFAL